MRRAARAASACRPWSREGVVAFGYRGLDGRVRRTQVAARPSRRRASSPAPDADRAGRRYGVVLGVRAGPSRRAASGRWMSGSRRRCWTTPLPRRAAAVRGSRRSRPDDPEAAHRAWHATSHDRDQQPCRGASVPSGAAWPTCACWSTRAPARASATSRPACRGSARLFGRDSIITIAAAAAHPAPGRARHAVVLARLQATERRRLARRAAGQDPARAAHRRAGAGRRDPAHALLRLGRRDAAVADAARRVRALDRRRGARRPAVAERARRARLDRRVRRPRRRRLRRVPAPVADGGLLNQGWKDSADAIRCADGRWPRAPSRWSRSRATSTRRGAAWRGWPGCAATPTLAERQEAAADDAPRAGSRTAFWLEDAGTYARRARRRQAGGRRGRLQRRPRAVERHLPRRSAPRAWREPRSRARTCGAAGASARCRARWPATTPSATTSARSGRTTTPSAPRALALRASRGGVARGRRAARGDPVLPRRPPAGAVLRLRPGRVAVSRCRTRSPARPRPGRRARCSSWSSATLGLQPDAARPRAAAASARRCPTGCPDLRLENLRGGRRGRRPAGPAQRRLDGVEVLRRSGDLDVVVRV